MVLAPIRRAMLILSALGPLLATGLARADPHTVQPAAWIARDVSIDLRNLPKSYSCADLWQKFHDVLLVLGARPDLKILTARCEQASRSPIVHLQFSLPKFVAGTATRATGIDAAAVTVRMEPGHPASLSDGDCELMRQIKDRLLAPLSLHVVSYNMACTAPPSWRGSFNMSVQTVQPASSGARVAEKRP